MRTTARHIVWFAALLLALVSCRGPRRIPRGELRDIYVEMFLADQHIKEDRALKRQADTMLVYEGIFEAHGYDTDDYLYSVEYYLRDPERFAKMMKDVSDRLDREAQRVGKQIEHEDWVSKFMGLKGMPADSVLLPFHKDSAYVGLARMQKDSAGFFFRLTGVQKGTLPAADTTGVLPDSLTFVPDTLNVRP